MMTRRVIFAPQLLIQVFTSTATVVLPLIMVCFRHRTWTETYWLRSFLCSVLENHSFPLILTLCFHPRVLSCHNWMHPLPYTWLLKQYENTSHAQLDTFLCRPMAEGCSVITIKQGLCLKDPTARQFIKNYRKVTNYRYKGGKLAEKLLISQQLLAWRPNYILIWASTQRFSAKHRTTFPALSMLY